MSIRQIAAVFALLLGAFAAGRWYSTQPTPAAGPQILYYQDPMHPAYRSDKPGVAPDCGMALVPVFAGSESATKGIRVTPETQQALGIRTAVVEPGGGSQTIRIPGRVVIDTESLFLINAPADGWFTGLHANVGDKVEKDQLLASYFIRELRAAVLGHFAVLDRLQANQTSPDPARAEADRANAGLLLETLRNLGVSNTQLRALEQKREVPDSVELRSPAAGVILARHASPGQRFTRGEELYRIADLSRVWIVADVFAEDSGRIPAGASAQVSTRNPARTFAATVSGSVPEFDPVSQTVKLRLVSQNPALVLKPDMFVDVEIRVALPPGLTVPREAVLDSGERKTVFLADSDGSFVPRAIETGWRSGGRVQVLKGLSAGDKIVVAGQFLLDSETRMQARP